MSEQTQIAQQRNKAINAAANPFDRKYVEKMLFAQFMPAAVNKRKTRSFLRGMARQIEHGYRIGVKDGEAGNRLIELEELQKPDESPMARTMLRYAYTAYRSGYQAGMGRR